MDVSTESARRSYLHIVLPAAILVVGLAITSLAWYLVTREIARAEASDFQRLSERVLSTMSRRFGSALQAVHGARGLMEASTEVSRNEWRHYVLSTQPYVREGLVGLGYIERVRRDRVPALEARMRAEGLPQFTVERSGDNEFLYVVTRIEPLEANAGALGLDVGSGTNRRHAAELAMETNAAALSARIRVITADTETPGFLLFLPIYTDGLPTDTVAQRTAALRGWVYASLRVDELTRGVAEAAEHLIDFTIYEEGQPPELGPLFVTNRGAQDALPTGLTATRPLDVLGKRWVFQFSSRPELQNFDRRALPFAVLLGGVLASALSTLLTLALGDSRRRALALVERRTAELSRANAQLEDAIAQAQRSAQEATRASLAKSQFLAMMSHEIRTPMNGVIGMTSLLLESSLTREQRDYAETIRSSGDALLAILNDILDFSKIESGKLELEDASIDVRACVEGVLDLFAARASEKGLELLQDVADATPSCVRGDPNRLRQVLVNLIGNAIKFTSVGEVVLSVHPAGEDEADGLQFSVRDTGIGIPPGAMNRLFQSFTQVDASTTRKFGGTGLGLAISLRLAQLMGGRLWAESAEGKGSTFHVIARLPVDRTVAAIEDADDGSALENKHVLIVDDNATSLRLLRSCVQAWGMVPHTVGNGAEAVELLRSGWQFHVALLDRHLPQMDARALAEEVRRLPSARELPLVLLAPLGHRSHGPFAETVAKPVKPRLLRRAMLAALSWHPPVLARDGQAPAAAAEADRHPDPGRTAMPAPQPVQLLLAEDNLVNQKVALQMLRTLGLRADVAGNGLEVFEALNRQAYDIILLDVQMPELDGLEVARRLVLERPDPAGRPWMIAVTANAMQGDRDACLRAGMDDYLSKPIRRQDLHAAIERAKAEVSRRHQGAPAPAAR